MPGVDASPAALRSGVGLVWRSMLLWMLLLLLLSLAGLFGYVERDPARRAHATAGWIRRGPGGRRRTMSGPSPAEDTRDDVARPVDESATIPRFRLPGGIPVPWLVVGLPVVAIVAIGSFVLLGPRPGDASRATPVARADLLFEDRPDGAVVVRREPDRAVVSVLAPTTNAFVRVTLAGLVRERRREHQPEHGRPFTITRWADGRLTLDDTATHRLIELEAFGPDNEAAFARLLDAAEPPPSTPANR